MYSRITVSSRPWSRQSTPEPKNAANKFCLRFPYTEPSELRSCNPITWDTGIWGNRNQHMHMIGQQMPLQFGFFCAASETSPQLPLNWT